MKAITFPCLLSIVLISFCTSAIAGNIYKWKPALGTSGKNKANWRTNCNVAGTVFPTSSDTLVFDSTCSTADCVLDTTFNAAKIQVKANYHGTITTTSGITLTFLVGLFTGGTFNGGSIPIAFNKSFKINGGTFVSTSDLLTLTIDDFIFTSGAFSHNNGTVIFKRNSSTTTPMGGTSNGASTFTMYKAEFAATSQNTQFNIRNITIQVTNELKLSGTYQLFLNTNTSSTIEVTGNLISTNTNTTGGGTIILLINGTGSQSLTGNATTEDVGKFPSITVNKASGTLSLSGIITLGGSTTWTYTAGTVSEGTARIICSYNNTLYNNSGGTMKFNKLGFYGRGDSHTLSGKVTVDDTLFTSQSGICDIDGDTLIAQGSIRWGNSSGSSSVDAVLKLTGTNAQTVYGIANLPLSKVWIAKTTGDITLYKTIEIANNVKFATGYLITDTTNILIINNGATVSNASSSSFVKGPVKKIGNSEFTFPIGKGSDYKPSTITAPSVSSDAFRVEYFNSNQSHGSFKDSLTYLSTCEYWNIARKAGTSNVKVMLGWNLNSCNIYTLQTLRIARWDGGKWNNLGPVTTTGNATAGTLQTSSNQMSYGDFIIAKRSPAVYANAGPDLLVCDGQSTTLGNNPSGSGGISPLTYTWSPSTGLNATTLSRPEALPSISRTYTLTVTDVDHSTASDNVLVTVESHPFPDADAGPDYTVCTGIGVILGASPAGEKGTAPYGFEWKDGNGNIISSEENPAVSSLTAFYSLQVTDSNSCYARDTMEIIQTPPPQAHAGIDTEVCFLSPVTLGSLSSATGGSAPYLYSWYPSFDLDNYAVANPILQPQSSESYILHVEDSTGCPGIDDTIEILIKERPIFYMGGENYICQGGDTVTLGTDTMIEAGHPPFTFYWAPNYYISSTAGENPSAYPPHDTVYYIIVTDSFGCTYYVPDSVTISHPVASGGNDQTIMLGCSIYLGGSPTSLKGVSPFTYLWTSANVADSTNANPQVTPIDTAEFTLKMTDHVGCIDLDTVDVNIIPHAVTSSAAIILSKPDTIMKFYKLITNDTVVWFKFQTDSTHAVFAIDRRYDGSDFTFTDLTLFSDSAVMGSPIRTAYLSKVDRRRTRGVVKAVLTIGNTYYLRLRKTGVTEETLFLLYSAVRPDAVTADLQEDY
jgi:hypothetical protein